METFSGSEKHLITGKPGETRNIPRNEVGETFFLNSEALERLDQQHRESSVSSPGCARLPMQSELGQGLLFMSEWGQEEGKVHLPL